MIPEKLESPPIIPTILKYEKTGHNTMIRSPRWIKWWALNSRPSKTRDLAEDTIVFYYGDHGSGMPRSKRWPFFSGLNVPLIVHVPEKWKHLASSDYKVGGSIDRRVGFVDLAPTLLSIAGKKPPAHMQGHAFMGNMKQPNRNMVTDFVVAWTNATTWFAP